jgi:hypothetical protein
MEHIDSMFLSQIIPFATRKSRTREKLKKKTKTPKHVHEVIKKNVLLYMYTHLRAVRPSVEIVQFANSWVIKTRKTEKKIGKKRHDRWVMRRAETRMY